MGSKSSIAESVISLLPREDNIYDLFGGGFAISHCAIASKKWKNVFYNEIQSDVVELVNKAINGDYNYNKFLPEWISREDFHARKDNDGYVKCIWSFGNNQRCYLFGEDIEDYKRSMHNFAVFNIIDKTVAGHLGISKPMKFLDTIYKRRIFISRKMKKQQLERLQQLERIERLEKLEQLQRLQRLQRLEKLERLIKLESTSLSYESVDIKPSSIIYCDPPYLGTSLYKQRLDHKKFYSWCEVQDKPLFISEYNLDIKGFKIVGRFEKISKLNNSKAVKTIMIEKVYANKIGCEMIMDNRGPRPDKTTQG